MNPCPHKLVYPILIYTAEMTPAKSICRADEAQPGHGMGWERGLVCCLLQAEVLQHVLKHMKVMSGGVMIPGDPSKIITVV